MRHARIALLATAAMTCGLAAAATPLQAQAPVPLRVCADPNYMPYSNRQGDGFENKIASAVASALGRPLQYVWTSTRGDTGFEQMLHEDLDAGKCDAIVDVPYAETDVRTTKPYYVSSYVFIYKRGLENVTSLDSPALHHLKLGYEVDTPVEIGLKLRALTIGAKPFMTADAEDASPESIVDAVASGTINVGLSWSPAVGYYVGQHPGLTESVIPNSRSQGSPEQYTFPMSMATRENNAALASQLDRALTLAQPRIFAILSEYHITYLKPNGNG